MSNSVETHPTKVDLSNIQWFNSLKSVPGAEILDIREWRDENWRTTEGGFAGRDFIHSKTASVRILDYLKLPAKEADPNGLTEYNFPRLVGPAHFTPRCESHRGLCHGGSFCALMDDAIGWMGFCVSGEVKPWSGYTVQVNTALKKPVPVALFSLGLLPGVEHGDGISRGPRQRHPQGGRTQVLDWSAPQRPV